MGLSIRAVMCSKRHRDTFESNDSIQSFVSAPTKMRWYFFDKVKEEIETFNPFRNGTINIRWRSTPCKPESVPMYSQPSSSFSSMNNDEKIRCVFEVKSEGKSNWWTKEQCVASSQSQRSNWIDEGLINATLELNLFSGRWVKATKELVLLSTEIVRKIWTLEFGWKDIEHIRSEEFASSAKNQKVSDDCEWYSGNDWTCQIFLIPSRSGQTDESFV